MNLRALILLVGVLLFQAGQGMLFTGGEFSAVADTPPCELSCCDALTATQGCCCFDKPASTPVPATPGLPPAEGRTLVPLILWTALSSPPGSALATTIADDQVFHADSAQPLRARPVSLAVLHCALLT